MKYALLGLLLTFNVYADKSSWELKSVSFNGSDIRTGIKKHYNSNYKDTILYLQGLGDSMLNHDPLFNHLNREGYDVIAFDYRGQGGSKGSMNSTRIENINQLADIVWNYHGMADKKKTIIGWSTGGLAAYRYAYKKPEQTKAIILLAPGIAPKKVVGETNLWGCLTSITIFMDKCKLLKITERSLTQNGFLYTENPHVDPIKPNSPLRAPMFATNLLLTARKSRHWKLSDQVKGIVYLSSEEDTYVNADKTIRILNQNADHFEYYQFGHGALHELDNELDIITDYLYEDIIRFLN